MSKPNIERLMELVESRSKGDDNFPERVKSDLTEQQQADQLIEVMAHHNTPQTFKVGDFVRYRKECGWLVKNARQMHIILEVYDPPRTVPLTEELEGGPTAYRKYNLLVGLCDPRAKGAVFKYLADGREMEIWPDQDRLKRQGSA